jgi:hypothetical protein
MSQAKAVKQSSIFFKQDSLTRSCVIDPTLALSQYGLLLVQHLAQSIEVWIGREFLNILDNVSFYQQQPHLLVPDFLMTDNHLDRAYGSLQAMLWALQEWEKFRMTTDLSNLNLFWLGDNPKESLLPKGKSTDIFWQWEAAAHSLDKRGENHPSDHHIQMLAFRDTVALAATLGSTFILTRQSPEEVEKNYLPAICRALPQWDISFQMLSPKDPIVVMERHTLRQLVLHTHTAKLLWAGLRLAVLHLVVPTPIIDTQSTPNDHFWSEAKGFLYFI